jgi:hypothetical protein
MVELLCWFFGSFLKVKRESEIGSLASVSLVSRGLYSLAHVCLWGLLSLRAFLVDIRIEVVEAAGVEIMCGMVCDNWTVGCGAGSKSV